MAKYPLQTLFKLLLIITMVVQPVMLSYAMAGVDHAHHQMMADTVQMAHSHHGMDHGVMDESSSLDVKAMSDCCDTSACCPVALLDMPNIELALSPILGAFLHTDWQVVTLPSEIKPPRSPIA